MKETMSMTDDAVLGTAFDAIGFDLDGVVYRGPVAVPGAPEAINELRRRGVRLGYVTNNAQRPPATIADQLIGFGIDCEADDIVTSAQATAYLMGDELPDGAEVLIVGSPGLADEIAAVGLKPTFERSASTAAIIVGFEPTLTWDDLNEGCYAVQAGARYYACNDDLTRPSDKGIAVGTGAVLLAMRQPLGIAPTMGGKPARPLLDEARRRLGAQRPLLVGDRLDTDIEGARNAGWASLFVLSGAHGLAELLVAPPGQRPDYLTADVSGLLEPPRVAVAVEGGWRCGDAMAQVASDLVVTLEGPRETLPQQLDAWWAVANLVWQRADNDLAVDLHRVGQPPSNTRLGQ